VALALMTPPRRTPELRWFLDISSWRFEEDKSRGGSLRDTWLPIQALRGTGLRERWIASRFGGVPGSTLDRIDHVTTELFSRPLQTTEVADLGRLATLLHPPPTKRRSHPTGQWRIDPEIKGWYKTVSLLTGFLSEPAIAPWPAPHDPPPASRAELEAGLVSLWTKPPDGSDPLGSHTAASGRSGYPPVDSKELFVCTLAARGRIDVDVLQGDIGDPQRLSAAYEHTAGLIGEVVDFLREDCRMPHHELKLVSRGDGFPALVRYVALHGRPAGVAATRLCQWYWRWAASLTGHPPLGDLLAAIDDDPVASSERLLAQAPATPPPVWASDDGPATLHGPEYLLGLLLAGPRDLATGTDITAIVTDSPERLRLRDILPSPWGGRLEGQVIQERPQREPALEALLAAPEEVLASHLLDPEAMGLLRSGEYREFLKCRLQLIRRHAREPVYRLAGWSLD
jgi:hypothetical protein